MSDDRERILETVRSAAGGRGPQTGVPVPPTSVTRPALAGDLETVFVRNLEAVAGTCERVATPQEVPAAVAGYLRGQGIGGGVSVGGGLESLPWSYGPADGELQAEGHRVSVITGCFAAIAETGSVVVLSADVPVSRIFLAENHIVAVPTGKILARIEDLWERLHVRGGPLPRSVNFITGPSRTADVEQVIQLGAHGPRRLHVILVKGGWPALS